MPHSQQASPPQRDRINSPYYTIYTAGNMFKHDELAMNVFLKDAVWRKSKGKYLLVLPQSEQPDDYAHPDVTVQIRNYDLLHVMRTDILLARFDGLELDAGTVAEYMMAKFLGKPAVILRSDSRRLENNSFDEPYNLMVKNYPRTVTIHIDSLSAYVDALKLVIGTKASGESVDAFISGELGIIAKEIDSLANQVIDGFDKVLEMPSPYPIEYQETVYGAARFLPGCGFDDYVSEADVEAILKSLRDKGSL